MLAVMMVVCAVYDNSLSSTENQRIPRLLHQTFEMPRLENLPTGMLAAVNKWRSLNPEYTHRYYNRAARDVYMREHGWHFSGLVEAYEAAVHGAAQVDLFRLLVLWVDGGVYLDIDLLPLQPLRLFIREDDQALSDMAVNPCAGTCPMIYMPQHGFLAATLERAVSKYREGERGAQFTAGPDMLGKVARSFYISINATTAQDGTPHLDTPLARSLHSRIDPDNSFPRAGTYWDVSLQHSIRVVAGLSAESLEAPSADALSYLSYGTYRKDILDLGFEHWTIIEARLVTEGFMERSPGELNCRLKAGGSEKPFPEGGVAPKKNAQTHLPPWLREECKVENPPVECTDSGNWMRVGGERYASNLERALKGIEESDAGHFSQAHTTLHTLPPVLPIKGVASEVVQSALGNALGGLSRFPESQHHFKRALEFNPTHAPTLLGLHQLDGILPKHKV